MLTDQYERRISVEKLLSLLGDMPKNTFIEVNRVGNLNTIIDGVYIGYIDIASEQYDEFPESWHDLPLAKSDDC